MFDFDWRTRPQTKGIILHDSHWDYPGHHLPYLRTRGRTSGLLEVGFHYVIERDGAVWQTRPLGALGSHAPGFNHAWIGVCLAGSETAGFSPESCGSLMALLNYIQSEYPETPLLVRGHDEVARRPQRAHTHRCPALDMEQLRAELRSYIEMDDKQATEPTGEDGLSTQNRMVLDYLKTGRSLTNHIAIVSLGIGSLTSRISELRRMGHNIEVTGDKDYHGNRYRKYALAQDKPAVESGELVA